MRLDVPLKAMCSRKCAAPLLWGVSYREPASIHTPTVAVLEPSMVSDATRRPVENWVISVVGAARR